VLIYCSTFVDAHRCCVDAHALLDLLLSVKLLRSLLDLLCTTSACTSSAFDALPLALVCVTRCAQPLQVGSICSASTPCDRHDVISNL